MTPALLAGYGVFFLLGFTLFALIYAAMGSFVSRPDDLQTLSLPLSLVAMVGYLTAIVALGGAGGAWIVIASFVPPFSPFVMLARIMVSAVQPWEVLVSVLLLVLAIGVVAVVATRMYAAGVLLYGQRPGLRAFVAAARRVCAGGSVWRPRRATMDPISCYLVSARLTVTNRLPTLPDMPGRTVRQDPRSCPSAIRAAPRSAAWVRADW
jgi:hypothetical protein